MTPIETHRVIKRIFAFGGAFVTGIVDPTVGLQQDGWSEVFFRVPPVGGAGGAAAGAEDAFVEAVEFFAVGFGLAVFATLLRW